MWWFLASSRGPQFHPVSSLAPIFLSLKRTGQKWKIHVFTSLYLFTYHPSFSLFLAFLRNLMLKQIFCNNRSHLLQGGWQWSGPGSGADGRSLGDWFIFFNLQGHQSCPVSPCSVTWLTSLMEYRIDLRFCFSTMSSCSRHHQTCVLTSQGFVLDYHPTKRISRFRKI